MLIDQCLYFGAFIYQHISYNWLVYWSYDSNMLYVKCWHLVLPQKFNWNPLFWIKSSTNSSLKILLQVLLLPSDPMDARNILLEGDHRSLITCVIIFAYSIFMRLGRLYDTWRTSHREKHIPKEKNMSTLKFQTIGQVIIW